MLDARFDCIPEIPAVRTQITWCKFTIACFRFIDVQSHFVDEGWTVRPLLVVRDPRSVFNSLLSKKYGRNGTTADDPPIRLRLRRFHQDWQHFRDHGWPILSFEQFVNDPQRILQQTCTALDLPWDEGMIHWPKPAESLADAKFGNETFVQSRGQTLLTSVKPSANNVKTDQIPPEDLEWIEKEFADMNLDLGYPLNVSSSAARDPSRAVPTFEATRRFERQQRKTRVSRFLKGVTQRAADLLNRKD